MRRDIDSHSRDIRAKFGALACDNAIDTARGVDFRIGRGGRVIDRAPNMEVPRRLP